MSSSFEKVFVASVAHTDATNTPAPNCFGLLERRVWRHSCYDFHMGRKLVGALRRAGFVVSNDISLPDTELNFTGAARPDVIAVWRSRFDRMNMFRSFCRDEFEAVREDFLNCLAREDHRRSASVRCVIAVRRSNSDLQE